MALVELTADNFDAFVAENERVVVEFGAQWCAPCRDFQRVLLALQSEYGDFSFAAIDIDREAELAKEFDVRSVPSILIIKHGVIVYAGTGALSAQVFRELLDQARVTESG